MTASQLFRGNKQGKILVAPNSNPAVLVYLKAAKEGKGLADKILAQAKKKAK